MKKIITLLLILAMVFSLVACGETPSSATPTPYETVLPSNASEALDGIDIGYVSSEELTYAEHFAIFNLEDEFTLLATYDEDLDLATRILVVPQDGTVPANLPSEVLVISEGCDNAMYSSSAMMSLTDALGCVDSVKLTTNTSTWYIDSVNTALASGSMIDVGKYTAPDYELIVANMPEFAVFSTMIEEEPTVYEQLVALDLQFYSDQSPNEPSPLGRTEWIKFLGVIYDKYDLACELFDAQIDIVEDIQTDLASIADEDKKSVLFFYVSSSGNINIRYEDDYLSTAVAIAGGNGIYTTEGSAGSSSITVTPEVFYAIGVDADVIIYNYTLGGKPTSLQDIIDSRDFAILEDFKAYQTGDVWATSADFYQVTYTIGQVIGDMNTAFYDENAGDELSYLTRLK